MRRGTTVVCRMAASAGGGRAGLAHAALRHLCLSLLLPIGKPTESDDQTKLEITDQIKRRDHMVVQGLLGSLLFAADFTRARARNH